MREAEAAMRTLSHPSDSYHYKEALCPFVLRTFGAGAMTGGDKDVKHGVMEVASELPHVHLDSLTGSPTIFSPL